MSTHPKLPAGWYRDAYKLDMKDMGWTRNTVQEIDFLAKVVPMEGPLRVLDLGCGFGRHTVELGRRGHTVVGIDASMPGKLPSSFRSVKRFPPSPSGVAQSSARILSPRSPRYTKAWACS